MTVMNRQMFQRTMPVRRQTGSPVSGETTVEDYIAKGFDPYEFEADQAMDQQAQQPQQQGFLSKIFDSISDYFTFGRSDPESRLIIGGDYYDPDDPSFKSFIERNYQNEGESYIDGIENFKNEVEGIRNRQEGSPMQGEITPSMYNELEGANDFSMIALKLVQKYGTPGEIAEMERIFPITRKVGPSTLSENENNFINEMIKKYSSKVGSDDLMYAMSSIDDDGMLTKDYMMDRVIERQEGSPMQGETVDPENVGIMSGFNDPQQDVANQVLSEGEANKKAVDESADYVELMDAIRGNDKTEEQRRDELAGVVGEADANKTPDSVLVLVQPVMQMLDATTASEGIAQMDQGQMMMPPQAAGIGATNVVMRSNGSPNTGEISPMQKNFEDNYATYMSLMSRLNDPRAAQGQLLFSAANRALEFGQGSDLNESLTGFIQDASKIGMAEQMKQSQLKQQLAMAALTQAQKQQLQALKTEAEKTKKKKTFVTGLNKDRDRLIAALLGLYKDAPTGPRGNPMGEGGLETTRVIDFAKLYELYPPGSELQFSFDLSEFLGKKGSTVTYAGKEDKAEGGIVERQEGSPPLGETSPNVDIGIEQSGVKSTSEIDDINKLIARSNATLKELLRMKEILVDDPGIGGFPGMILENFQGLFTMFNQIDNAYLEGKFIDDQGEIAREFSKDEIQEIQNLKNSIARGIADLASFKGTRQPTTTQEAISLKEIDPTGFFGSEVAMGKVDAVADKVARLLQEYLKLVTTDEDTNIDLEALAPKIDQLNQIVEQIKNYKSKTGSEGFKDQKSYTLDEIEAVIANQ